MSPDVSGVPAPIAQAQLIRSIGESVGSSQPAGWSRIRFVDSSLSHVSGQDMFVTRDGVDSKVLPPMDVVELTRNLREVMFRPGAGTWFVFELTLTPEGGAESRFDYDSEPTFRSPIDPVAFRTEQEKFPRDPENQPQWFKDKIAEAGPAPE